MDARKLRNVSHASPATNINWDVRREEYLDYMTFESNDRPLFTQLFGPLVGLKEEWTEQGATPEELDLKAFKCHGTMRAKIPVYTGWLGGPSEEVLEDTDDYRVVRDSIGRTMKLCKGFATRALPMDFPVKNMDDWLAIKHHYEFSEERFGADWEQIGREHLAEGRATIITIPGGFDEPRQLMGEEELCVAFHTQPELVHAILETIGDTAYKVLDRVSTKVVVDELFAHEDMAGKSGPLAGPKQIEEFIGPYYRRIWDMLHSRGTRLFVQDSDGDMNPVISAFLDAGLNVMYPMEPAAGMDIVRIREKYGTKLAFMGGIDKHVLRRSKEEIIAELEYKIPPMVRTGGCILALDHLIPNGTPLENYRFYMRKAWEILEREAAS